MTNVEKNIMASAVGLIIGMGLGLAAIKTYGTPTEPEPIIIEEPEEMPVDHITLNIEPETEPIIEEPEPELTPISLGKFRLTAYCPCEICCGKWAEWGLTASGTAPKEGRTIAVDDGIIALGEKVVIDGHTYTAEDTGSAINGNRIDIFFDDHTEARNFGVQYKEVFLEN